MSLSGKIKNAGFWQAFEVITKFILQFVYFAIMARILLKEDYGLMAIANGIIGIGAIFISGGMGTALIQKIDINDRYINAALQTSLFIGLLLFFIFFITASIIGQFYDDNRLESVIQVISINFVLLAISNISVNLLHKSFKFKNTSLVTTISLFCGYSMGISLAYMDYGVWSLIIATLFSSFISTVGFFIYAPIKVSRKIYFKEAKELFGFGSGMMLLALSNFFSNNGLNLVLGKIFSPSTLGIFERSSYIKTLPSLFLGDIIDKVMFPVMSEIQNENNRLISIFKFTIGLSNSLMIPVTVFLMFFTPEIVHILMGDEWLDVIIPLQIMFIVLPFSNSGRMADSIVRAKGLVYKNVTRKYIFTGIIILLSSSLGYFYGVIGAAIGICLSYVINYLMMLFLVKNIFRTSIKEIFYIPIISGLKLGAYVAAAIIGFKQVFNLWSETNIFLFICFTLFLGVILLLVLKFIPALLGPYISTAIIKIRTK